MTYHFRNDRFTSPELYRADSDYRAGYDAAALCEEFDKTKPDGWREGWQAYQTDMDTTEGVKYI